MKIFHVDDDPNDRLLVRRAFEQQMPDAGLRQAGTRAEFLAALREFEPDVAVLDYALGWATGLELFRILRDTYPDAAAALFTASLGEEGAVEVMRAGMDDYVLKDVTKLPRLVATVEKLAQRTEERRERRRVGARHAALWRASSVGLLTVRRDGSLVAANPAACRMLNIQNGDLGGTILIGLVESDRLAASWAAPGDVAIAGLEVSFGHGRAALLDAHSAEGRDGAVECALTEVTDLQAALRRAQVAVREVYHRVYNNLQVIEALLAFQAKKHVDPAVRNDFRDVSQRLRSLALAQQRLHEGDDFSSLDFGGYLHEMAGAVASAYQKPEVSVDVRASDDLRLPVDVAIPLGLLATELLTNALKHAFPDKRSGRIVLYFHQAAGGGALLRVVDDGVGSPRDLFQERSRAGVGSLILSQLALQIGAKARFSSSSGVGTDISVEVSGERLRMPG